MELYTIETGNFMLDGGAMFGAVPKVIWSKQYAADENNLINCCMRSLLVVHGDRKVLLETGIGTKQSADFLKYYYLNGQDDLISSIRKLGFSPEDITDVVLSHLHFDHCGGAVKFNEDHSGIELTFKNATHWISKRQWEWALHPNARERSSFLKENILPISESGKLKLVENEMELFPGLSMRLFHGHTDGQIISLIEKDTRTFVYVADFIPSSAHIPLSYVPAYDTRPLITFEEKKLFLKEALNKNYILIFLHDLFTECCTLKQTDRGIRLDRTFRLADYFRNDI